MSTIKKCMGSLKRGFRSVMTTQDARRFGPQGRPKCKASTWTHLRWEADGILIFTITTTPSKVCIVGLESRRSHVEKMEKVAGGSE